MSPMIYRPPTTYRYLSACAEIEKCAALMYEQFAREEKTHPGLQHVWKALATEEKQHVTQIELLRGCARKLQCGEKRYDCEQILELAQKAERCLSKVLAMSYDPHAAFKMAVSLESWYLDLHAGQTERVEQDRFRFLFSALAADDLLHVGRIQAAYAELFANGQVLQPDSFANVLSL